MARMRRLRTQRTQTSGGQNPTRAAATTTPRFSVATKAIPPATTAVPIMSNKTASGEIDRPDSARSW